MGGAQPVLLVSEAVSRWPTLHRPRSNSVGDLDWQPSELLPFRASPRSQEVADSQRGTPSEAQRRTRVCRKYRSVDRSCKAKFDNRIRIKIERNCNEGN
ncbi:Protein of unknown function [Gryllus bimaculatus]|nr:Protein of unknown function [Gryllus bimaculatus]